MLPASDSLPAPYQALRATAFGPAVVRTRLRRQNVRIDALLRVSQEIDRAVSEAKLAKSLLDVSRCAERIVRRYPSAKCSKEQLELALVQQGAAAHVPMVLGRWTNSQQ